LSGGPHENYRKSMLLNKLLKKQFMNTSLKLLDDFDFILYNCHSLGRRHQCNLIKIPTSIK